MTTSQPPAEESHKEQTDVTVQVKTKRNVKDRGLWRDLTAYWMLGLCNNYGYVVMLSAAHDIINQFHGQSNTASNDGSGAGRHCNLISTGAILLADVLPSLLVKLVMPFFPLWIHFRIGTSVILAAAGFLLVAFANADWVALLGVISTSASSGIGETSFLAYSSKFNRNVISTWSSGTGGAGVIGSLSYATLRSLGVSPRDTMLIMLFFPVLEAISFWILLRKPIVLPTSTSDAVQCTDELTAANDKSLSGFKEKCIYATKLYKYMLPLALVYFFEYFINQGLFELVYFEDSFLDKDSQYRWLNVDYQIGVFISRSSVNLVTVNKIWLMSIFQFINVAYFLCEVLFFFTPSIWITYVIVLWEGLLGGGAYVNTFYKMSKEIPSTRRKFAIGMVVQSDSLGIALAGFLAIPTHNAICGLAAPARRLFF